MAKCECLSGCLFFNDKMKDSEGLGKIYKQKYCLGDNTKCARYLVYKKLGKARVPNNLYPNMLAQAEQLINKA